MKFVQPIRDKNKVAEVIDFLHHKNKRDELMFLTGIYTGMRISDILQLKIKDVRDTRYVNVKERKTSKTKRFYITGELRRALDKYIREKPDHEFLFKSREGKNKPITRVRAYEILREAAKACGLKEVGTHTMRKTFGYHIYQKEKDVAMLQDIFNHSSQYITLKYIGVNQDAIDRAVKKLRF